MDYYRSMFNIFWIIFYKWKNHDGMEQILALELTSFTLKFIRKYYREILIVLAGITGFILYVNYASIH